MKTRQMDSYASIPSSRFFPPCFAVRSKATTSEL
jgi:hypothetical protein